MGRKAVSPATRKLHGSPRDHRDVQVIQAGVGDLWAPPDWYTPEERKYWAETLETAPPGLLTASDRGPLTLYVSAMVGHMRARRSIRNKGLMVFTQNGNRVANPALLVADREGRAAMLAAKELGFTPGSRSSLALRSANGVASAPFALEATKGPLVEYFKNDPAGSA